MAQVDILREILDYSLRKFEHHVIGSKIYFSFNNERYAFATLKQNEKRNEYNGISIIYVSKLFGLIDQCDIYFNDVFIGEAKRATINVNTQTDEYEWYNMRKPSSLDLKYLAEHVERYMNIIGDFGESPMDYIGVLGLAAHASYPGLINGHSYSIPNQIEQPNSYLGLTSSIEDNLEEVLETPVSSVISEPPTTEDTLLNSINETFVQPENISIAEDEVILALDNDHISVEEEIVSFNVTSKNDAEIHTSNPLTESSIGNTLSNTHSSNEGHSSIKNLFNIFRDKEKHEIISESCDSEKSIANNQEEQTAIYTKPFVVWNIGSKKNTDVIASLYNIDKHIYSLVISGTGEMQNFKSVPWLKYKDQIAEIKINDGVVSIGNNAFKSFGNLKTIVLPNSIVQIGLSAFEFCFNLKQVTWSENLKVISSFAFSGAENLKEVNLPASVQEIADYAFDFKEDFIITHVNPKDLLLGAGISYTDFKNNNKSTSNFSAKYNIE